MVGNKGFEPSREFPQGILSPRRLPISPIPHITLLFCQSLWGVECNSQFIQVLPDSWRKVRDSNPRALSGLQFSRLVPSASLSTFRVVVDLPGFEPGTNRL